MRRLVMSFNICYCGVQAGYRHAWDCPYPLFRGSRADEDEWYEAREAWVAERSLLLNQAGNPKDIPHVSDAWFPQPCRDCGKVFPYDPDADRCPACAAATIGLEE
jgi:hypothetical protein